MKDILLTAAGDLHVSEWGDINLTDSVQQAVKIRLLWFFKEWRFAPKFGIPYYEEILVKNPNQERIKRIIKSEIMTVAEVLDARNITIEINKPSRTAKICYEVVVDEGTYGGEVLINV